MNYLKSLLKDVKAHELFVTALLIIYILAGISTPEILANLIDTTIGTIVVVVAAVIVFCKLNSVLGVVFLVAIYELIKRSSKVSGKSAMQKYLPTENKKNKIFNAMNQFPVTLEEEVVRQMAPLSRNFDLSAPSYKPVLDDEVGGSKIE